MAKSRRNKHYPVPLSSLFGKVLPENFRQKSATIHQYQQFFNSLESDAVFQMVEVINVTDEHLSLAVPSPSLVNYLRLHSQQLRQQIEEQFGLDLELIFKVLPESISPKREIKKMPSARHFSASVSDQIKKSSSGLDDEELRNAMISLADTIKNDQ